MYVKTAKVVRYVNMIRYDINVGNVAVSAFVCMTRTEAIVRTVGVVASANTIKIGIVAENAMGSYSAYTIKTERIVWNVVEVVFVSRDCNHILQGVRQWGTEN